MANADETLFRTYNVTNGGTTTLAEICVTDKKFGIDECLACIVSDDGHLPPGEYFDCTIASTVSRVRLDGRGVR